MLQELTSCFGIIIYSSDTSRFINILDIKYHFAAETLICFSVGEQEIYRGPAKYLKSKILFDRGFIDSVIKRQFLPWEPYFTNGQQGLIFNKSYKTVHMEGFYTKLFKLECIADVEDKTFTALINIEAEQDNIFGVPTIIIRNEPFWGHDRISWVKKKLDSLKL